MGKQRSAQLIGHQPFLFADDHARVAQHRGACDRQLVLAQLVREPAPRREMYRPVNLDGDEPPAGQLPFSVEISTTAAGLDSHLLQHRLGQPMAPAEPDEVDLAQGLGAHRDVVDRSEQRMPVPGSRRRDDGRA